MSTYNTAKRSIIEYFKYEYKEDQESMLRSLLNEEDLKKFINMKTYGDSQAARWLESTDKSDTSNLGLTEFLPDNFKTKNLPDFLPYAFAELVQYRANTNREIGDKQINQQLAALATMRIAKLLKLEDISKMIHFIISNNFEKYSGSSLSNSTYSNVEG